MGKRESAFGGSDIGAEVRRRLGSLCPFTHPTAGPVLAVKQNPLLDLGTPPVASDAPSGLSALFVPQFPFHQMRDLVT